MRRRFAVPLIAAVAAGPWLWFHPETPPEAQPAMLSGVVDIAPAESWMGGFSGIEVTAQGDRFYMVTDRGHIAQGTLTRSGGTLSAFEITQSQPLVDQHGQTREFPHTDAEGIALDETGGIYVSFEHAQRVLYYDTWDSPAIWPSYSRTWRALPKNKGLEALALGPDGALYLIPEEINAGAWESLVYKRSPGEKWQIPFTLPIDSIFAPVGADFGPDGRLYVLERGLYPFGFYSRVRVMDVTPKGFENIQTVLRTSLGDHGNLEGISVWQGDDGNLRLTMVSDDNFKFFMRSQIVEYVLKDRVAKAQQ